MSTQKIEKTSKRANVAKNSTNEITIPHGYIPRDYQLEFLQAKQRFKIAVWHRRSGKSKTVLNEQVRKSQLKKGVYYYILPTYRAAKNVVWDTMVTEHIPEEIIAKKNQNDLTIYYKNGSIHRFVGCEEPDQHRGINPIDVVFDEYSEEKEEMWTAIIQPVLRENHGTATFIYTPKGKNHSWKLLQVAKEHPKEWFWSVKSVHDTNGIESEELEQIKKQTPLALYQQEYECAFLDGASQLFRGVRDITYDERMPLDIADYSFNLGTDLAKYNDWTVLTPFNTNTGIVYAQDRFNNVDWPTQEGRIEAHARRYNHARVRIDSTGVGDPVVDNLRSKGLNIAEEDAINFSGKKREQLLLHLSMLIENKKIKIPNDEGLISELEAFRFEMTDNGTIKLTVPRGIHDDRVMSLALACWNWEGAVLEDAEEEFGMYSETYN